MESNNYLLTFLMNKGLLVSTPEFFRCFCLNKYEEAINGETF